MKDRFGPLRPVLAVLFLPVALGAGAVSTRQPLTPDGPLPAPEVAAPRALRLVPAAEGNEARYRVREQLAGLDLPNDAVGVTGAITGALVFAEDGSVVTDESKFVVDLATLKSDKDRRDNYIRRRTLQTDAYPTAEFAPTGIQGMPFPPPGSGEFALTVVGDLTIHGVTRLASWAVVAQGTERGWAGKASTEFTFADFGMEIPRVAIVLSVQDTIRLEFDFNLVTESPG